MPRDVQAYALILLLRRRFPQAGRDADKVPIPAARHIEELSRGRRVGEVRLLYQVLPSAVGAVEEIADVEAWGIRHQAFPRFFLVRGARPRNAGSSPMSSDSTPRDIVRDPVSHRQTADSETPSANASTDRLIPAARRARFSVSPLSVDGA